MKISGFTFLHNYSAGYPIREAVKAIGNYCDEVVAVDMQSTDGTRAVLESLGCRIIDGEWGTKAEMTLCKAHALHTECRHDQILHFEADEIWDDRLVYAAVTMASNGFPSLAVHRLQVEQNFQRVRWYPELVHRVFRKGQATKDPARGHTTKEHESAVPIGPEHGFLWDVTNCFRDQFVARAVQNSELWEQEPNFKRVPIHSHMPVKQMSEEEIAAFLAEPHWTWKETPLAIPEILRPLLGVTCYV